MSNVFDGLKPALVWEHFYNINQIPRCSKNEEGARAYVKGVADRLNLEYKEDAVGNIVVKKAASAGMENSPTVILQGHVDMVCEKNKGTVHDFTKDPIKMLIDDGWVRADGTTLGADNAIGVCMGLALLEDDSLAHPPLEVLCTIDEETGMTGAMGLEPGFLDGKIMLNLDTEEEGALYIGCAGGKHTIMTRKIDWQNAPSGQKTYSVKIKGLRGGHSGLNIVDQFGNAIKLLTRVIYKLGQTQKFSVASINGGTAHNAIPREAEVTLVLDSAAHAELEKLAAHFSPVFSDEFSAVEKDISFAIEEVGAADKVFSDDLSKTIISFLYSIPHGVEAMSQAVEGLVETSTNMAVVETRENELYLLTSQRSSVASSILDIADKVKASAELAGFDVEQGGGYPAWQPNPDSPLLKACKEVYSKKYGEEAEIKAVHAGLECGIIGEQFPGMDMISLGPDILGAHSPDERVKIDSVNNVWEYLLDVLKAL
ncbi:MAG: aminoacyl-histidine dipeptidase [Calditrichaeota bacterium]|nr:MAG: aminoacyl-histidine dipeptidase [Calditrichota bacterium]MBL1204620.1 aminoacyl-histidine dipeptidase [Calditrichota bacterium]NOG44449.1 aminoacyl-histidine dipeptidase [Calditrichota bacterium]